MTSGQSISKLKHDKKYSNEVIEPLEKEHKTLKIIKEKKWLVEDILNAFIEDKEKHDLLKEVLL